MALSPDEKKIYINADTTAGQADGSMYFPVKYLTGLESITNNTVTLYFRGPNNTTSTSVIVLITTDFIKEFYTQFVNEINFGDKAVITLAVKNLSVSTTEGGSDFVYVNATAGAIIANDDTTAYEDLQIAEDLDVGGNLDVVGTITGDVTGDVTGNADTATLAVSTSALVVADESTDTTCFPVFVTAATGATLAAKSGSNLTFNSNSGLLTATLLAGNLTGDVTGNADTATALATARAINGVDFDGSAPITVTAAGSTLSDTVTVAKGGTGLTTVGTNEILTGNGTSALTSESNLTFSANRMIIGADAEITPQLRLRNDENTVNIAVADSADNIVSGTVDGDFVIDCNGDHNVLITQNNTVALTIDTNGDSNFNRRFTVTGVTDGTYEGDVVYFGATTSMTLGKIYHYKSDGTWELANADDVSTCDGLLAVALGAASDTNGMLLRGMVTLDHDPGSIGDVLYVQSDNAGTPGNATSTAPSANGDCVRIVGYQVFHPSAGHIWFNPDGTFVEVTA